MGLPNLGADGCKAAYIGRASASVEHVPPSLRSHCLGALSDLILAVPEPLPPHTVQHAWDEGGRAAPAFHFVAQQAQATSLGILDGPHTGALAAHRQTRGL